MKNKNLCLLGLITFLAFVTTNMPGAPVKPGKRINDIVNNVVPSVLSGNIEYGFAKTSIRPVYYDKLNKLANYLIENKAALTLRGYADSIGSYKSNWKLSEKRAIVVKAYLIKKGVSDEKIITTAFGSTQPITTNRTREGRQKNRRVEIKINPLN